MRPRPYAPLLTLAAIAGCALVGTSDDEFSRGERPEPVIDTERVARRAIDAGDIRRHVGFLASEALRGSARPGAELDRAASWIGERFREAGLEPAGDGGGYVQFWPYPGGESEEPAQVPNVVGILPGADPARSGEYVVLLARFGHVPVGASGRGGDSVHHRVSDDASGAAALLELADAFRSLPSPPPRPIVFLATSGSGEGLLGARWFAENPTVFLSGAVAVLNMDRIGRNQPDTVDVVGYHYSTLGPLLERVAAETAWLGLTIRRDPPGAEEQFRRGDQHPFARRGIPAVAVSTGLHEDDHARSGEPGSVDAETAARVARLVFLAAHRLASGEAEAAWTDEGRSAVRR